jgi:hypothetical protein
MHISSTVIIATLVLTAMAPAQDKKIQRADLPAPVEKALASQSQGATIKEFSLEKENGQTYYEAEMAVAGHSRDVLFDPNGAVVEGEVQVAFDALPAAAKEGRQAKTGWGKILKVESISKHDRLVAYEAKVQNAGKPPKFKSAPMADRSTTKSDRGPPLAPVLQLF